MYVDLASSHPRNEEEARFLAYLQEAQGQRTTTPFSALLFSSMLARSRLLGRFCGVQHGVRSTSHIPQRFVSIYREVILDFFAAPTTRRLGSDEKLGFNGTFKIIPDGGSILDDITDQFFFLNASSFFLTFELGGQGCINLNV